MTRVFKGNGERVVPDEKVAEYLAMGYSVINSDGKVVIEGEPVTLADFKAALAKERAANLELKKRIVELEKAIADNGPIAAADSADKPDDPEGVKESPSETETPQKDENGAKKATAKKTDK